jgi:hypothetical protein
LLLDYVVTSFVIVAVAAAAAAFVVRLSGHDG